MIGHVYAMNCDCGSYMEVRKTRARWIDGPRCRGCGATLGWMQWTYCGKVTGADTQECLANWRGARKAAKAKGGGE